MRNFILSLNFKNSVKASFLSLMILIASLNFGCLNASAYDDFPFWETNMYVTVNLSDDIDDKLFMEDLENANTADDSRKIAQNRFPKDLAKQSLYDSLLDYSRNFYRDESKDVQCALDDLHKDINLPFGMIDCGSYYIEVGSPEKHPYDDVDDSDSSSDGPVIGISMRLLLA